MPSLPSLLVRVFLSSKYCTYTRLQVFYDSLQHGAWTSWHSRLFFAGHQGGFRSTGSGLANFTRYNIPSSVLANVRSWIVGFLGRRCLNSWFICASVSRQFSFKMSFRQFLISSSTRTWFAPPRGLSAILPSIKYRRTILLAVDRFTPSNNRHQHLRRLE